MRKKMYWIAFVCIACLFMVSCNNKKHQKVEYQAWLQCSEDLLHYVTPVMEYSDYTGAVLTDTLMETDFLPIESQTVVTNGDTAQFLKCDLVNKVYSEFGITNRVIVRYIPKDIAYGNENVCFGHALSDSVTVKYGNNVKYALPYTNHTSISSSNNVAAEVEKIITHIDTLECVVDEDGNVEVKR